MKWSHVEFILALFLVISCILLFPMKYWLGLLFMGVIFRGACWILETRTLERRGRWFDSHNNFKR